MVVGTGMLAYGLTLLPNEKRRPFLLLVGVTGIAAIAYALMALDVGAITSADGAPVYVPRYVDWLLTTPMHVAFIALLAGAGRSLLYRLLALQALTIAFGFAGAVVASPLNWVAFALGGLAFAAVVYYMYTDLGTLADERSDAVAAQFRKLRSFVVVLWLIYPVIWVAAQPGLGLMDSETATLVIAYIDVVAKVGFGLIALNDYVNMDAVGTAETVGAAVAGESDGDASTAD
jgi:sensory rhodopsin